MLALKADCSNAWHTIAVTSFLQFSSQLHSLSRKCAWHTMSIPELIDHGEAASAPVADNRRGDGNPAAQNGLQSRP